MSAAARAEMTMSDDRAVRVWASVGQQAEGRRPSVTHVCAAAVARVGVDGVGLSIMVSPILRETMYATDRTATELEELQLTFGEGPCVDTFTTGWPVLVADLRATGYETRWPAFTPAALRCGATAMFALPLRLGHLRLGAIDLYRAQPGLLDPDELADALVFAHAAGVVLLDTAARLEPDTAAMAWPPAVALADQALVHQATGMVSVQLGVSVETAFIRLRAFAYANDQPLSQVAATVVHRRLRFDPDPVPETPPLPG